jgi:hypothetical protein
MPFDPAAGEDAKKSLLLALAERWLDHSTGCFASEADRAVVSTIFRTFDQATASVCTTCG